MGENLFILIFLLLVQSFQYYTVPMVTPTSILASVIAPISRSTPMPILAHMDDHEGSQDKNPVWVKKEGMDCFNQNGAVEIGPEPYSYSMTLDRCKAACRIDSSCEGIIRNTVDQQNDNGKCFLRKNLNLQDCKRDTIYSLYYILKEDDQNYQMHEAGDYEADDYQEENPWTCTCRDFVNRVGYGDCMREHPTKGFICYVIRPSACDDLVQSVVHRGMLMSALACSSKDGGNISRRGGYRRRDRNRHRTEEKGDCSAPMLIDDGQIISRMCGVTKWTYDKNKRECKSVWTNMCEARGSKQNKFGSYIECSAACKSKTVTNTPAPTASGWLEYDRKCSISHIIRSSNFETMSLSACKIKCSNNYQCKGINQSTLTSPSRCFMLKTHFGNRKLYPTNCRKDDNNKLYIKQ